MPGRSTSQERPKIDIIKRNIENVKGNSQKFKKNAGSSQCSVGYAKIHKDEKTSRRSQSQKRTELKTVLEVQETKNNNPLMLEEKDNKENIEINNEKEIVKAQDETKENCVEVKEKPAEESLKEIEAPLSILSPTPLPIHKSSSQMMMSERKRLSMTAPRVSIGFTPNEQEELNLKRTRMSETGDLEVNDTEHSAKKLKIDNKQC
ncbi:unnamed protein product [Blepharisma stoltei]|uniref:Shugoshin C-terminal domain-containing protein n=1 Tax=Blepharisma stoltei TaxID=1481888 RepID=A0AAU9IBQ8_9CILI|nr:unnamed protein product [Blepharisma stoltei]